MSGAAGINPPCSPPPLTPHQNRFLLSASLHQGCRHVAVMERCTCSPFPLTQLMCGHGRTVGWGFLGSPEPAGSMSPSSPGVPGKAAGCRCPAPGKGGPSPAKQAAGGEGASLAALPARATALKPGLWPMGPAREGSPSNKPPPCKKRQRNQASSITLNQNNRSGVRLLSGRCFVPFRKHSLMGMKYAGSCRSRLLCEPAAGLDGQDPAHPPWSRQSTAP